MMSLGITPQLREELRSHFPALGQPARSIWKTPGARRSLCRWPIEFVTICWRAMSTGRRLWPLQERRTELVHQPTRSSDFSWEGRMER